jgi:cytochrome c biogenesis protein CcmG/thiol:disulfide interchange protein DsbE
VIAAIRPRLPLAGYVALALGVGALAFFGMRSSHGSAGGARQAASGPVAPGFRLYELDGVGSVDLARYAGKTVVVNFWASWCGPCEDEASTLESASRRWSAMGVQFIGVDSRDSTEAAKAFVDDHTLTYPIAIDDTGGTASDYGVSGMPQTFVISADGQVLRRIIGPVTASKLDSSLQAATGTRPSASTAGG